MAPILYACCGGAEVSLPSSSSKAKSNHLSSPSDQCQPSRRNSASQLRPFPPRPPSCDAETASPEAVIAPLDAFTTVKTAVNCFQNEQCRGRLVLRLMDGGAAFS